MTFLSAGFVLAQDSPSRTAPKEVGDQAATNSISSSIADELRWLKAEKITIKSVSKRPEDLFGAAAAVSVVTGDDIRRSGSRSIAEALRMVPGMSVAQGDANTWAISPRGFNNVFADKVLVLVDGRTVYSPVNNGVFWNLQDYLLEDIDRIEVIRGPGGTLWGANAVNGVINVITKEAKDSQGVYVNGGGGSAERGMFAARYGAAINESAEGRMYFNYRDRAPFENGHDSSEMYQAGFRTDWLIGERSKLTWQGDGYSQNYDTRIVIPSFVGPDFFPFTDQTFKAHGWNTLARYNCEMGAESEVQLQGYYDYTERADLGGVARQVSLDLDAQHRFALGARQILIYGAGYRYFPDQADNNAILTYRRPSRDSQLFNAFIQDEIALVEERLKLTLGTKVERNDTTGFEVLPNARLTWQPNDQHTLWCAVSRAVQMPGPSVTDISVTTLGLPPQPVGDVNMDGMQDYLFFRGFPAQDPQVQTLLSYELGYRVKPVERLTLDFAAFYNQYRSLVSGSPGTPFPEVDQNFHLVLPISAVNDGTAETYGFEVSGEWSATDWWRLSAWYSLFRMDVNAFLQPGRDPQHQVSIRSSLDLTDDVELDLWARYVDALPAGVPGGPLVSSYFDLDVRLAWRPTSKLELAVVGQNLIAPNRTEFSPDVAVIKQITSVPRGVYGTVTLRF